MVEMTFGRAQFTPLVSVVEIGLASNSEAIANDAALSSEPTNCLGACLSDRRAGSRKQPPPR